MGVGGRLRFFLGSAFREAARGFLFLLLTSAATWFL